MYNLLLFENDVVGHHSISLCYLSLCLLISNAAFSAELSLSNHKCNVLLPQSSNFASWFETPEPVDRRARTNQVGWFWAWEGIWHPSQGLHSWGNKLISKKTDHFQLTLQLICVLVVLHLAGWFESWFMLRIKSYLVIEVFKFFL